MSIADSRPVAYIGIGNNDGKLTQQARSELCEEVAVTLDLFVHRHRAAGVRLIGAWYSLPATPYLSAVFAVLLPLDDRDVEDGLREELTALAAGYELDAIAWARAPHTVLLTPPSPWPTDAAAVA